MFTRKVLLQAMRAISKYFWSPQQIHFGEVLLAGDLSRPLDVFLAHDQLFFGGSDAHDFGAAFGQLLHHAAARAAQQDGLERFAQLVQVAIALDPAPLVDHAVPVQEAIGRTQPPVVDKA